MPILPVRAYTSEDWFAQEQAEIFGRSWQFAGLVEDLAQPGQYQTVQAGPFAMVVVHGPDGQLRAFHNLCRHRGTQLLRGAGRAGQAITCPYHDWTYDHEGRLISVPNQAVEFPDMDRSCLGLKRGSVCTWRGMVFVHAEPDRESCAVEMAAIEPYLAPYDPAALIEYPDTVERYAVQANWKIVAENYIDAYHLSHLHSGTLRMYDHDRIESRFVGDHYVFFQPCSAVYAQDLERHAPYPLIDDRPVPELGAYVPLLFPGLGLVETESSWSVFHIRPLSAQTSEIVVRTRLSAAPSHRFNRQDRRSQGFWRKLIRPKYAHGDEGDPMQSADVMQEDLYVCEQQQKALHQPVFEHGPSARIGEAPVRHHQTLILERMKRAGYLTQT